MAQFSLNESESGKKTNMDANNFFLSREVTLGQLTFFKKIKKYSEFAYIKTKV